jgi:hypothetical protein
MKKINEKGGWDFLHSVSKEIKWVCFAPYMSEREFSPKIQFGFTLINKKCEKIIIICYVENNLNINHIA